MKKEDLNKAQQLSKQVKDLGIAPSKKDANIRAYLQEAPPPSQDSLRSIIEPLVKQVVAETAPPVAEVTPEHVKEIVKVMHSLPEGDKLEVSKGIRNASSFIFAGTKYGTHEMMHGGSNSTSIGTVTSISQSTGILLTPNPIITTGTVGLAINIAPIATLGTANQQIRVNAGATALEYFTPAGATIAIGGTVTGGTDGSVLFINPANTLAQDNANFNFNNTTNQLNVSEINITGLAGAGYINFPDQAGTLAPSPTGVTYLYGVATGGFTRLVQANEGLTDSVLLRDSVFIAINNSGSTIVKGAVVNMDTGVTNDIPSIVLADDASLTKFPVAGVVIDDITNGNFGRVMVSGILKDVDGLGFTPGFPIYLHPTTPGGMTTTRPVSPQLAQRVGISMDGGNPTGAFYIDIGPFAGGLESGTTAAVWRGQTAILQSNSSLSLGLESTNTGAILFKNATNGNALTIQSGVVSAPYTLTLPTAVAATTGFVLTSTNAGVLSWAAPSATTTITTADESSDTTTFPLFVTASGTQTLQPKNNVNLTFNSSTGALGATTLELGTGGTTDTTLARVAAGVISIEGEVINGWTTTATAGGTTTLTITDRPRQQFTGSATQIVKLPTTSVVAGQMYTITNQSTGLVTIQSSGANSIVTLGLSQSAMLVALVATPTTAANWEYRKLNRNANTNGKRILVVTQSATPSMDTDNGDIMQITGLAQAITSMTTNLTGTPVAGDMFELQITDSGTGRALTFGASFGSSTVTLPTTTVASTMLRIGFQFDTVWRCIAVC